MAKKVSRWQSDDGRLYETEVEALRADAAHWKKQAIATGGPTGQPRAASPVRVTRGEAEIPLVGPGGGQSNNHP